MARKIIQSVREQYDRWFKEEVFPQIPTVEEVASARALMVEAQKKHEIVKSRYESYQLGMKLITSWEVKPPARKNPSQDPLEERIP